MVVGLPTDSRHQEWSPVSLGKGVAGQRSRQRRDQPRTDTLIERILGAYWALLGDYHNDCAPRICSLPRRGPTVGLAVRGARPPGLRAAVCHSRRLRPTGPPDARLRGGAPHEAERRCGARAGGAGWVGPPASRRRRCVRRSERRPASPASKQFVFVEDVVAVEDGVRVLVAGQEPSGERACSGPVAWPSTCRASWWRWWPGPS